MIEVGEYVRTKNDIEKVVLDYGNRYANEDGNITFYDEVVKHSKNIIDLIEVGDFVNGEEVTYINKDPFVNGQINLWVDRDEIDSFGDISRIKYTNKDIKSIVTKEQFKNIEYIVED